MPVIDYAAYIDGKLIAFDHDDIKLFEKVLSTLGQPPDFIGYINRKGKKTLIFFHDI